MPQAIDRDGVQALMGRGAHVVEVLPQDEYDDEHLPGAVSIPLSRVDREAIQQLDRSRPVIVYCADHT